MDWVYLPTDITQWQALINTVINRRMAKRVCNVLDSCCSDHCHKHSSSTNGDKLSPLADRFLVSEKLLCALELFIYLLT